VDPTSLTHPNLKSNFNFNPRLTRDPSGLAVAAKLMGLPSTVWFHLGCPVAASVAVSRQPPNDRSVKNAT
jgi:hypothetical protein